MKSFHSPLLAIVLLIAPQVISGLSVLPPNTTPSGKITLGTESPIKAHILPVVEDGPVVPTHLPAGNGPREQQQILPIFSGSSQPSFDILPPEEYPSRNGADGNVDNSVKTKRENDVASQNGDARFLVPGFNWGWTGIIGGGNNGGNYEKPGSCYRPGDRFGSGGGYRNRREAPYDSQLYNNAGYTSYSNGNGGGFGGGNAGGNYNPGGGFGGGSSGGNYNPGNEYYNPGGQHGGNGIGYPNPGGGSGYCYRDRDCSGNKKCCDRVCRTPAYVG